MISILFHTVASACQRSFPGSGTGKGSSNHVCTAVGSFRFCLLVVFLCAITVFPMQAFAAEPNVMLKLRPHCEAVSCPDFSLRDTETYTTNGLDAGRTLDLDIVLENPTGQPIQSVQSWLTYNPKVLKGTEIRISDSFPLVAPGEQNFAEDSGTVKIGASNVSGGMKERIIVLARVQFTVLKEAGDGEKITFKDYSLLGQEGKTKVLLVEAGRTVNILKTRPKDLFLYFGNDPSPSIGFVPAPTPTPTPTTTPLPVTDQSFATLQPQGLRVMTERDQVYLIWSALADQRIVGYNIYYGTISGRYIQRRTVSTETTGVTIRNLPVGKRYFFAVAAFNAYGQDSEYSFEVSVIVGDAASSTAPFTIEAPSTSPISGSVSGTTSTTHVPSGTGMPFAALGLVAAIAFGASIASFFLRRRSFSRIP